jgi:hypothetical protein
LIQAAEFVGSNCGRWAWGSADLEYKEENDKKLACLDVLLIESSNTIEFSELGRKAGGQRREMK